MPSIHERAHRRTEGWRHRLPFGASGLKRAGFTHNARMGVSSRWSTRLKWPLPAASLTFLAPSRPAIMLVLLLFAAVPPPQGVLSSPTVVPDNAIAEVVDFSGDTVIAGTGGRRSQLPVAGSVRLFDRVGGLWTETYAADGATTELVGYSVAVEGDVAAYSVGLGTASLSDDHVVVLERTQGGWAVATILSEPSSIAESSQYGRSIAISGTRIAISAHRRINSNPYVPQAYVYDRTAAGWSLTDRLRPQPDPVTGFEPRAGAFATPVALDGDRLALGAGSTTVDGETYAGRVFIFERDLSGGASGWGSPTWVDSELPRASDSFGGGGLTFAGADLAVGALRGAVGGFREGTVAVFSPTSQGWARTATLSRPVTTDGLRFGWTLDGSDDYIAVGADRVTNYSGSLVNEPVEVYARDAFGAWQHAESIFDPHYKYYSYFGNGVAISGAELVIGASRAWAYSDERGAAYVQPLAAALPLATEHVCPGDTCPCPTVEPFAWMGCFAKNFKQGALSGGGSTSLALDNFEVVGEFLPANVMFMTAAAPTQPGAASSFARAYGSGTLCMENPMLLPPRMTTLAGLLAQPPGLAGDMAAAFGAAGTILIGESWMFQAIYRDGGRRLHCGSASWGPSDLDPVTIVGRFNVTNGVAVTFGR